MLFHLPSRERSYKTEQCRPLTQFPEGFDIWQTPNHWANGETSIRFVNTFLTSLLLEKIYAWEKNTWLWLFDIFKGHTGSEMESLLLENNVISVIVPNNCTDVLQPLHLSVNKPLKDHHRSKFQLWYSEQVSKQMEDSQRTLK